MIRSARSLLCVGSGRITSSSLAALSEVRHASGGGSSETESRTSQTDDLQPPAPEHLAYEGTLTPLVRRVKFFSMSTTALGLGAQPYLFSVASHSDVSPLALGMGAVIATTMVFTPLVLNVFSKRYITQLYFDPEKKLFTAYCLNLVNRRKRTDFTVSDVSFPEVDSPFTSFKVHNKPFLVDPEQFSNLDAYKHLMGYDKPVEDELPFPPELEARIERERKEAKARN